MALYVTRVRHHREFWLELGFNNGAVKQVDLSGQLHGEAFEPLRSWRIFEASPLLKKLTDRMSKGELTSQPNSSTKVAKLRQ